MIPTWRKNSYTHGFEILENTMCTVLKWNCGSFLFRFCFSYFTETELCFSKVTFSVLSVSVRLPFSHWLFRLSYPYHICLLLMFKWFLFLFCFISISKNAFGALKFKNGWNQLAILPLSLSLSSIGTCLPL